MYLSFSPVSVRAYFHFYNFYTFYKLDKMLYFSYLLAFFISTKCRKTVYKA